jgi:hypothetical protein
MYSFLELDEDYIEMDCEKVNKLVNTYVVYDKPFTPVVDVWGYYDYVKDKYLYPYIPNQNLERTTLISEAKYQYLNYTVMYHCTRWLKNFFYSANLVSETDFDTIGFNVDTLNAICEDLEVPYPDWDYYFEKWLEDPLSTFTLSSGPYYLLVHQNKPVWYSGYFNRVQYKPKHCYKGVDGTVFTHNAYGCIKAYYKGKDFYREDAENLFLQYKKENKLEDAKYFSMKIKVKDRVVQSLWDYDELSNKIDELVGDSEYSDNSVVFKNFVKAESRDLVSV